MNFILKVIQARLYDSRKKGGRGLINCEECLGTEENSLSWYIVNSSEEMLLSVNKHKIVQNDEAVEPVQYQSKLVGKKRKCMANLSENCRELIGTKHGNRL